MEWAIGALNAAVVPETMANEVEALAPEELLRQVRIAGGRVQRLGDLGHAPPGGVGGANRPHDPGVLLPDALADVVVGLVPGEMLPVLDVDVLIPVGLPPVTWPCRAFRSAASRARSRARSRSISAAYPFTDFLRDFFIAPPLPRTTRSPRTPC